MSTSANTEEPLSVQAARWTLALQTGGEREHAEFAAWIRQSPHHVREFLLQSALDQELSDTDLGDFDVGRVLAAEAVNVVPLAPGKPTPAGEPNRRQRPLLSRKLAIAASVGALVAIAAVAWLGYSRLAPRIYETAIGEQRTFELSDGSIVQLNPQSRLRLRFSADAREIDLLAGEAGFKVEHNRARPFRVHAGRTVIEDIGTRFHVNLRGSGVVVSVLEGAVDILPELAAAHETLSPLPSSTSPDSKGGVVTEAKPVRLDAGEAARIADADGALRRSAIDPAQLASWHARHLTFSGDPLSDIVEEFNRYNRAPRIHVRGEALRARRFSGSFEADDPESLIEYLRQVPGVVVTVADDEVFISQR